MITYDNYVPECQNQVFHRNQLPYILLQRKLVEVHHEDHRVFHQSPIQKNAGAVRSRFKKDFGSGQKVS